MPMRLSPAYGIPLLAALVLGGCNLTNRSVFDEEPTEVVILKEAPPGAPPGTCWGKDVSPAVIETVTEQVIETPAILNEDGSVQTPAVYRTERSQAIVKDREDTLFQVPCENDLTPEFIASIQRALKARNLYSGPIHGELDQATRFAIRQYQKAHGLNSSVISLTAARRLGLVALDLPGQQGDVEDTSDIEGTVSENDIRTDIGDSPDPASAG